MNQDCLNNLPVFLSYDYSEHVKPDHLLEKEKQESSQKVLEQLLKSVEEEQDVHLLKLFFLDHIKSLRLFIENKHKEMLYQTDLEQTGESYRQVKHGFCRFFLYLFDKSSEKAELLNGYENLTDRTFGHQCGRAYAADHFRLFFEDVREFNSSEVVQDVEEFFDELLKFRKDYLTRFSLEKVQQKILEVMQESEKDNRIKLNQESLSLLRMTFIHGSNSGILPNLLITDLQLIPTGELLKLGIVPLSGNLTVGCGSGGINQQSLSGTSLDEGSLAISYATRENYHTVIENERRRVQKLIDEYDEKTANNNPYFSTEYDSVSDCFVRGAFSIRRIRALDPETYKKTESKIKEIIRGLKQDFLRYKQTQSYRHNMPKKEDPSGELGYHWHDDYWYHRFERCEYAIESLEKSVEAEIIAPEAVEEHLRSPYSIIFGSTTLHTKSADVRVPTSEQCVSKAAKLGNDIQYLFVKTEDKEKIDEFLIQNKLKDKVAIKEIETLKTAILYNQFASPYFADIISGKKMKKNTYYT